VSLQSEFKAIAQGGGRAALVTVVEVGEHDATRVGAKVLVRPDDTIEGDLGHPQLDAAALDFAEELMWAERSELREVAGTKLFVDVVAPPPRLIVFGAVDFAAALCRMAKTAGWRPFVVDPRGRFATRERFPDAEEVIVAWPEKAFAQLGGIDRATYIAVLTHDPKLDDAALTAALASDAPYIGAMGSRRAQEKRRERLLALGVAEDQLARIAAPIGLDLGGLTAEETALSIMAEVAAVRNGREGGRLSAAGARRIHEVGT
jgi:xanthine dehydrogenase accessory factor